MAEVLAPDLGQSGAAVTIETWLKQEGDTVEKGEGLFEISNEKLTQVVESPLAGTLTKILVPEGEKAKVSTPVAEIE